MKILVTGIAGFIGFHLAKKLVQRGHEVLGLDNINDYYDVGLKFARLNELGFSKQQVQTFNSVVESGTFGNKLKFVRMHLENRESVPALFEKEKFQVVCHLAAQAGVRYSLENPEVYVDSNVVGFLNILEACRKNQINHFVYASSSSVYGLNKKVPFEVSDTVDCPISLYAATKRSNELMAHTYSHLSGIPTTGLRFFTVYGPWGRPDMALFLFTEAVLNGKPIKVFNKGAMKRDFTFINDVIKGVTSILEQNFETRRTKADLYKIYNIGNNQPIRLLDFIKEIENNLNQKAVKEMLPMQPGDVEATWANVDSISKDYDYKTETNIKQGVAAFIKWYKNYYSYS